VRRIYQWERLGVCRLYREAVIELSLLGFLDLRLRRWPWSVSRPVLPQGPIAVFDRSGSVCLVSAGYLAGWILMNFHDSILRAARQD
jgi:hypothetical protein